MDGAVGIGEGVETEGGFGSGDLEARVGDFPGGVVGEVRFERGAEVQAFPLRARDGGGVAGETGGLPCGAVVLAKDLGQDGAGGLEKGAGVGIGNAQRGAGIGLAGLGGTEVRLGGPQGVNGGAEDDLGVLLHTDGGFMGVQAIGHVFGQGEERGLGGGEGVGGHRRGGFMSYD